MNWKRILPILFAALFFTGASTAALADNYRGYGRSHYGHRVAPHHKYFGHDYRWQKRGGYHHKRKYHGKHYYHGPRYGHDYAHPYRWHGGQFSGGTLFLPGWGVVFGGQW